MSWLRTLAGPRLVPAALATLLAASIFVLLLAYTEERAGTLLSAPLDDTFIHFQYAKQLARARPFQFNDGDSPTTGATSPLYMLLLAPGWLVGFKGLKLLIWAWLLNGALHVVGGLCLFSIVRRLTGRRGLAYGAMACLMLNGPLIWGTFSNMEVGLFSTLLLLALLEAVRLHQQVAAHPTPAARGEEVAPDGEQVADADQSARKPPSRSPRWLLLWGVLLALVRPEGLLLAGSISLWLLWPRVMVPWSLRRLPGRLWSERWLTLPLLAGVALLLLYLALTGRIGTNAAVKSHLKFLGWAPGLYAEKSLDWLPMTLTILLEKWRGLHQQLATALALVGMVLWAAGEDRKRPGPGILVLGWLVLLTLFYSLMMARRDHLDRYYLPYVGLTVVLVWWCLGQAARRLGRYSLGPTLLGFLMVLLSLPQTRAWAARFGDNCRDLAKQHFVVAKWVRKHTPADAVIAVNDAGAIPYLTGRRAIDIVGLAHNAFYRRKTLMPYNQSPLVWEALEALPHRPDYMVAYPEWIPDLHRLRPFELLKRFPLTHRTMVANDVKMVWKMRWDLLVPADVPRTAAPPPARKVVDQLDVADLNSEEAHGYQRLDTGRPTGMVRQQPVGSAKQVLIDGGRHVATGERLRLRCQKGRPAHLVLRYAGPRPLDLDVRVEGQAAGRWRAPASPIAFSEARFPLPAALLTDSSVQLELHARRPYTAFHYWLQQ